MDYSQNTGLPNKSICHKTHDDLITTANMLTAIIQAKIETNDTNGLRELADTLGIIMEFEKKVYKELFA